MAGTGIAKEKLGKTPRYRNAPDTSGTGVGSGIPYGQISFIRIVDGSRVTTDKWLEVTPGVFVNYIVGGLMYFDVLKMPDGEPQPEPEPDDDRFTVTFVDNRTGETYSGLLSKQ